jgi:hypothetical protein
MQTKPRRRSAVISVLESGNVSFLLMLLIMILILAGAIVTHTIRSTIMIMSRKGNAEIAARAPVAHSLESPTEITRAASQ